MDVGIIGLGAIGGWVAARLALAGHRVSALVRGSPLGAIEVSEGGASEIAPIISSDRVQAIGPQELVIIAVKAPALADAVAGAMPMIGPKTIVLPMLNGVPWWFAAGEPVESVDPGGRIADAIELTQVLGCVVHAACRRNGPGRIVVQHADRLIIGEPGRGVSERSEVVARLFTQAGIRADLSTDIRRDIWYKLWGNMTVNPLSALTLATADRVIAECRPFILACMTEAAAVGAAIGCPIAESGEERMAVTARLGAFRTSMLQDVEAGRPIELEALLGAPRELARRAGVPTPHIDTLYALTRLMAKSRGLA